MLNEVATPPLKSSVWIDLNICPIPDGYDAAKVRPCIESALETIGCSGPPTINVFGTLEGTSDDVLRALSSTGVVVQYTPPGVGTPSSQRILAPLLRWQRDNPPPAKIVFISDSRSVYFASRLFSYLQELGFHILVVYGDTPKPPPGLVTCASWQWLSLLDGVYSSLSPGETRKQPLLQDKPASFVCRLCCDFTSFQYFECQSLEDLTTHFNSEEHKLRYFQHYHIPGKEVTARGDSKQSKRKSKRKVFKAGVGSFHLMNAATTSQSQRKLKLKLKLKVKKNKKKNRMTT
ncbi:unnamed protein product [Arabidopsis halleri]